MLHLVKMPSKAPYCTAKDTLLCRYNFILSNATPMFVPQIFTAKHASEKKERWVSGNSVFFRMHHIGDIYFVGGFGTVQWIDVAEYTHVSPDAVVMNDPHRT